MNVKNLVKMFKELDLKKDVLVYRNQKGDYWITDKNFMAKVEGGDWEGFIQNFNRYKKYIMWPYSLKIGECKLLSDNEWIKHDYSQQMERVIRNVCDVYVQINKAALDGVIYELLSVDSEQVYKEVKAITKSENQERIYLDKTYAIALEDLDIYCEENFRPICGFKEDTLCFIVMPIRVEDDGVVREKEEGKQEEQIKTKKEFFLRKMVFHSMGIQKKYVKEALQYKEWKFFTAKDELKDGEVQDISYLYVEHNDHLFPIASLLQVKEAINDDVQRKELEDILTNIESNILESFEYSIAAAKKGEYSPSIRINFGYAEYLGRVSEAKEALSIYQALKFEKDEKERIERERLELIKAAEEAKICREIYEKAETSFRQGEMVDSERLEEMFDKYNVKIPIKLRGWMRKSLIRVSATGQYRYSGNKSTSLYKYIDKLIEVMKIELFVDENGKYQVKTA